MAQKDFQGLFLSTLRRVVAILNPYGMSSSIRFCHALKHLRAVDLIIYYLYLTFLYLPHLGLLYSYFFALSFNGVQ